MPQPLDRERRYLPGLDGLRALAVAAVVLYHLGYAWAAGGFLGVSVFFTLSGYLITDLILGQGDRFRLRGFWIGRARRLLPGLAAMLIVVTVWVALRGWPSGYTSALVGAALYASNWQLVAQHVSYFARFGPPTPLQHLWSLGVEEQFYLLWPVLLVVLARLVPERRPGGARPRLALVTLALAVASAVELRLLYHPGFDTSRVYYGTDTRASELLVGAALAMLWPSRRLRPRATVGARRVLDVVTVAGIALVAYVAWTANEYSPFVYRGGIELVTVGTALAILGLAHPAARIGRLVGAAPLRWVGVRSYGIYLWHLPVILLTTPAGQHRPQLTRSLLQVAAIVALAALSWRFVEEPLRARRRPSFRRRDRAQLAGVLVPVGAVAAIAVLGLAATNTSTTHPPKPVVVHRATPVALRKKKPARPSTHTSCNAVIHIGDSTSEGLTSTNYLPNPIQRMDNRYRQVGVQTTHFEISGARSIVETYEGEPNAAGVVRAWKSAGYHGCWVLALGTNDTADVAVGSNVGRLDRVKEMMSLIGRRDPVLWIDVKSLVATGPYSESNMQAWNAALRTACGGHPNMRVYDWASAVKDKWFISDGIHFNTPGYAARARLIAHGLAAAFPAQGGRPACVVS